MTDKKEKPTKEEVEAAETIDLRTADPLAGLPDWIKHPKAFMQVEKALLETLACKKSHSDPLEVSKCQTCTRNMVNRRELMKKMGFANVEQYMQWKKVHQEIKKYVSEEDYERMLKS